MSNSIYDVTDEDFAFPTVSQQSLTKSWFDFKCSSLWCTYWLLPSQLMLLYAPTYVRPLYSCTFRCSRLSVALLFLPSPDLCLPSLVPIPTSFRPPSSKASPYAIPILLTLHFSKTTRDGRREADIYSRVKSGHSRQSFQHPET